MKMQPLESKEHLNRSLLSLVVFTIITMIMKLVLIFLYLAYSSFLQDLDTTQDVGRITSCILFQCST